MKMFPSPVTVSLLGLIPFFLSSPVAADASNAFSNPSPSGNQNFTQGDLMIIAFNTNYKNPYLSLFCSNIVNPIVFEKAPPPTYTLQLDIAPQPNCYLQVQEGEGPANTQPSFGTGIFRIVAGPQGSHRTLQANATMPTDGSGGSICNCQQQCALVTVGTKE